MTKLNIIQDILNDMIDKIEKDYWYIDNKEEPINPNLFLLNSLENDNENTSRPSAQIGQMKTIPEENELKEESTLNIREENIVNDLENKRCITIENIKKDILIEDELEEEILAAIDASKSNVIPQLSNSQVKEYETDSTCLSRDTINSRIIISILCHTSTLPYLHQTLEPLYRQHFHQIYLFTDKSITQPIDEDTRERCKIIECQQFHPYNHIFYLLEKEPDPNTILVFIRNGHIYPDTIEKEVKKCLKRFPQSAHSMSPLKFKSINFFDSITINGNVGDIYETQYLITMKRSCLKNDFLGYLRLALQQPSSRHTEEVIICNYLNKYKIPLRCLFKKKCNKYLVRQLVKYETIHRVSGLNYRLVNHYFQVIQHLEKTYQLYLRNAIRIYECMRFLSQNRYPVFY